MNCFLKLLHDGRRHLMDGAMGTEIVRRGVAQFGDCLEALNLSRANTIRDLHRDYIAAGAEIVLTHTFQANVSHLAKFSLADQHDAIWRAAIRNARGAACVLADVGPWTQPVQAWVAPLLRACGDADGILLETWTSLEDLQLAARLNTIEPCLPLAVSFTFRKASRIETFLGDEPETCARAAEKAGAVALGVNCGRDLGRGELVEIVQRYRTVTDLPVLVRPNAGTPDGEKHPHSPEQIASWLGDLRSAGATLFGGCCGTTPAHIAAMRGVLDTCC